MNREESIAQFDAWFQRRSRSIADAIERGGLSADLVDEVSQRVRAIDSAFRWEIGPQEQGLFFAFGCSGRAALLELSREVVHRTTNPPGWVVLPAKPPKEAKRLLVVHSKGKRLEVNFEGWLFAIDEIGERLRVLLKPDPVPRYLSADELEGLGWMVVEFELGEELVLEEVGEVVISQEAQSPIAELRQEILDLL